MSFFLSKQRQRLYSMFVFGNVCTIQQKQATKRTVLYSVPKT